MSPWVTTNLRDFLAEIIEYMEPRLDVDEETPGRKVMNQEGHLMVQAQDLLDSQARERVVWLCPMGPHKTSLCGSVRGVVRAEGATNVDR